MGSNYFTRTADMITDSFDELEEDREREILNDHALSQIQKKEYIQRTKFIIQYFRKTSYEHFVTDYRDCKEFLKQN